MQETQKDYVEFMKSHGKGSNAERQNLRMEAEDSRLSSGTIVSTQDLDGNIEPKSNAGRDQP